MVSAPAFADDEWYAALESTIVETGDVQKAVETASEAGAEPEQLYLAVSSVLDDFQISQDTQDQDGFDFCAVCAELHCCDSSPSGDCGLWYTYCESEKCCD